MTDKLKQNPQPELSEHDAELLSAYIDEMLSADEAGELEARLLNDAFLRDELVAMRQTVIWMNALPTLKAPRDFTITAQDVAPAKATGRKVIPMQNRNLWFVASAAAILIVLVGFGAVFSLSPLSSDSAMIASGDAPESIAFSATQSISSAGEAELQTFDIADNDTYDDTAVFAADSESESGFAGESAEMDDSAIALSNTVANSSNTQAQAPVSSDTSRSADGDEQAVALADIQTTATSLVELLASTPTSQVTEATLSIGQGGGAMSVSTVTALPVVADSAEEPETSLATGNIAESSVSEILADTGADARDEDEAPDAFTESDGTVENEDVDDTISTGIESRSIMNEPSNLIQAVLNAVRIYVESHRP